MCIVCLPFPEIPQFCSCCQSLLSTIHCFWPTSYLGPPGSLEITSCFLMQLWCFSSFIWSISKKNKNLSIFLRVPDPHPIPTSRLVQLASANDSAHTLVRKYKQSEKDSLGFQSPPKDPTSKYHHTGD